MLQPGWIHRDKGIDDLVAAVAEAVAGDPSFARRVRVIVAGADWNSDRLRVGLVAGAMLIGVVLQSMMSDGDDALQTAKHHGRLLVIVMVILGVVAVWAVRRGSRASQSDPAG